MNILLIEKDPFVRTDMAQALSAAFPKAQLVSRDQLDASRDADTSPQVAILDSSLEELTNFSLIESWMVSGARIVLTDGSNQSGVERAGWRKVERPFTDQSLLDAVRQTD